MSSVRGALVAANRVKDAYPLWSQLLEVNTRLRVVDQKWIEEAVDLEWEWGEGWEPYEPIEGWFHEAAHVLMLEGGLWRRGSGGDGLGSWISAELKRRSRLLRDAVGYQDRQEVGTIAVEYWALRKLRAPVELGAVVGFAVENQNVSWAPGLGIGGWRAAVRAAEEKLLRRVRRRLKTRRCAVLGQRLVDYVVGAG